MKRGVSAMIFEKSLWEDMDAVRAIASIGNLNAKIDAGEDEMQAFGRIDDIYNQMSTEDAWKDRAKGDDGIPVKEVMDCLINRCELGRYAVDDWKNLIALRQVLTPAHSEILKMCQFNAVGAQIRLRCSSFAGVSTLDRRCPMVKVALLLFQYLVTAEVHEKAANASNKSKDDNTFVVEFAGRKSTYAKFIGMPLLSELRAEVSCLLRFEKDLIASLQHYRKADVSASFGDEDRAANALMTARGAFLSKAGKLMLRLMRPFEEASAKKKLQKKR